MKIGRIAIKESTTPAARQEKVADEIEKVIASFFSEPTKFVVVKVPAGDRAAMSAAIVRLCDEEKCPLVLTTSGVGVGENDYAPEALLEVVERRLPGFGEIMRFFSYEKFKVSVLSRAEAGVRGKSLVINLPSRPKPVKFCLRLLQEGIAEALHQLSGEHPGLRGDEVVIPMEKYLPFLKWARTRPDPRASKDLTL